MATRSAELIAIQERVNKHLPRLIGEFPDVPVKVVVQRGERDGSAIVRLWYDDRGAVPGDYESGRQLILSEPVDVLATLPDLAFKDWLAKAMTRLLRPEN